MVVMSTQLRTRLVSEFVCLTDSCEDTCCKHWSMQMDAPTFEKYKTQAPDLLSIVEEDADGSLIMRKDKQTGFCAKYDGGKCGVHIERGESFLGDACHFYPRVTRRVGEDVLMSATMSCPEVARLALYSDAPFVLDEMPASRLPHAINDILPDGLSVSDALAVHQLFIAAAQDEGASAEHNFARIASVARSIAMIPKKDWAGAVPFYLRMADGRIAQPEKHPADAFNLLHALCGLVVATKKTVPPRLRETMDEMQAALHVTLDFENAGMELHDDSEALYKKHCVAWQEIENAYAPFLKRWLAMQISTACFPFAGLGDSLEEKISIIGVRLATLKLALICACGINEGLVSQNIVVRIVQSLSRLLDHLGDPAFSLQIYAETGWIRESRMRGLLEFGE